MKGEEWEIAGIGYGNERRVVYYLKKELEANRPTKVIRRLNLSMAWILMLVCVGV